MNVETVDNITAQVANEGEAFLIIHALRRKFGMVGTEFSRDDLEDIWNVMYSEGQVDTGFTDDHWEIAQGLRSWYRTLSEWMTEKGWEWITESVVEEIDACINGEEEQD